MCRFFVMFNIIWVKNTVEFAIPFYIKKINKLLGVSIWY